MTLINRIADLAQLYQEAGRLDDARTLTDYISRQGESNSVDGKQLAFQNSEPADAATPIIATKWRVAHSAAIAAYVFFAMSDVAALLGAQRFAYSAGAAVSWRLWFVAGLECFFS